MSHSFRSALFLSLTIAALAGGAHPAFADHPWPSFRHDSSHTGRTAYSGPGLGEQQWIFTAPRGAVATTAAVAGDGTIYIGSGSQFWTQNDSTLYAVRPDGSLKWARNLGAGIFAAPTLADDGTLYVTTLNGTVHSLADQGTHADTNWSLSTSGLVMNSPTLGPDGTVYYGGLDFKLAAVSSAGELKWQYMTDWCLFSTPLIGPAGEIYFGSKDHHLYCLEDSVSYGKVRWAAPTGTFYDGHLVDSSPARAPDGTLYVGTDPYGAAGQTPVPVSVSFFAFGPDGSRKWSFPVDDGVESSPALAEDGTIYFGSHNGSLYAIRDDGAAATRLWEFATAGQITGSPAVDGMGTIYIGSKDGNVYALRPDGSLKWSFATDGPLEASPALGADGVLYISTMNGTLYAIGRPGPDVAVLDLDLPDRVATGSVWAPRATVRNFRSTATSCRVALRIAAGGQPVYSDTVTTPVLAELADQIVEFAPWSAAAGEGIVYDVTLTALLDEDNRPDNDVITAQVVTAAGAGAPVPQAGVILARCYPNPFNPVTTIPFELPGERRVSLRVYDVHGRLVETLLDGRTLQAGSHAEVWTGRDHAGRGMPSGLYLVQLRADEEVRTRSMTLLR